MAVTSGDILEMLRDQGWSVAVHNDYTLKGGKYTFWLMTKDVSIHTLKGLHYTEQHLTVALKGEGGSDLVALIQIRAKAMELGWLI